MSTAILRGGQIVYEPRALCWHEHRKDGDALRGQVYSYGVGLGVIVTKALTGDPRFYIADGEICSDRARAARAQACLSRRERGGASRGATAGEA